MASEQQKPEKRTRAYAPKVRTGCLTCKKRHRKCDEEKPVCRRCRDGGYVCDGYTSKPDKSKPETRKLSASLVSAKKGRFILPSVVAKPPQRFIIPGNPLETLYLDHFWTTGVRDLEFTNATNVSFWRRHLGGLSQQAPCIHHALIALGATHWLFITPIDRSPSLESFAVYHYNQSIADLVPLLNSTLSSPQDLSTVLTCCMLFILFECIRGNHSEAFRHLESGARLITDRFKDAASASQSVKELAYIFDAISDQVSIFSDGRIFPDLSNHVASLHKYPKQAAFFRDLDEAEDVMNELDETAYHIYWDLEPVCNEDDPKILEMWFTLQAKIDSWATRFERLMGTLTLNEQVLNKERILNLKVQYKMWLLYLEAEMKSDCGDQGETDKDGHDDEYEIPPSQCNELLDEVERLWKYTTRPTFTLKVDQISSIIQLYAHCSDGPTRQRIISILRSRKRREIIWHSEEVAEFLERDMLDHVLGLQPCNWPEIGPSEKEGAMLPFRPRSSVS